MPFLSINAWHSTLPCLLYISSHHSLLGKSFRSCSSCKVFNKGSKKVIGGSNNSNWWWLQWFWSGICVSKQKHGSLQWAQQECSLFLTPQLSNSPSFHFTGFWPNNSAGHCNSTLVTHPFVPSLFYLCQTSQITMCRGERKEGREGLQVVSRAQNKPHAVFSFIWPTLLPYTAALHDRLWDCLVILNASITAAFSNDAWYHHN